MKKYSKLMAILLVVAMILPGMAQAAPVANEVVPVERIAGSGRVQTAVEASKVGYAGGADAVVLAGYSGEVDALTGTLLANAKKAPVLLTRKEGLSADTKTEIERLGAKTVYILGGESVVSKKVVSDLEAMTNITVERVEGDNRYATAHEVAKEVKGKTNHVFLALGEDEFLADALSVGSASAVKDMPVLLTKKDFIPQSTLDAMTSLGVTDITLVGGINAISEKVEKDLKEDYTVGRVWGVNRERTAAAVANEYFPKAKNVLVAQSIPDALVGGYLGAKINAPILLTKMAMLHPETEAFIKTAETEKVWVLGGDDVISVDTFKAIEEAIKGEEVVEELKVESVSAINGAQVEVKFNKAVDKASVFTSGLNNSAIKTANFAFTGIDGAAPTAPVGNLSEDGKILVITANNQSYEGRFKLVIDNVKATDGKDIVKYDQVVNFAKDTVAPTVLGVEKLTSSTFKVKFSEPMKTLGTVSYKLANGTVVTTVTSDFAAGKQDVVFTLGSGINANDVVTATFVGAQDQASNLINPNPTSVTFTKGDKDGVRPEVSSVAVKGLNKFEIKFSEQVQNLLVGNIYVDGTALTASDTITQDKTDKTKYEVTLNSALTAGLHKIEVKDASPTSPVTDLSGEILKDFSQILAFKADTVAPKFVSSAVVIDATTQKEKLVLTFDKEIAQPAAFTSIVATELTKEFVTTTATLSAGQLTVNADNKKQLEVNLDTVKFSTANLEKDATYTVKFPKGYVKGENIVDVEAFNVTFKRGQDGIVAADAPTVNSVTATTNDTITVLFDKALDGATATNAANYTIPGLVIEKAELGLDSSVAKKVTLTLAKGTNTVNGDRNLTIKNVKAKDGKVMDTVTKLVTGMKENVAPTIQSAKFTGVTSGNVDKITLTFSEAVKATDTTTDIFEIYVGDSTTPAAVSNVDLSGNTDNKAELTVTSPLTTAQIEKGITVKVKTANKVVDLNNNKLDFTSIKATY